VYKVEAGNDVCVLISGLMPCLSHQPYRAGLSSSLLFTFYSFQNPYQLNTRCFDFFFRQGQSTYSLQYIHNVLVNMAPSQLEKVLPKPKIEMYSGSYFLACGLGGIVGLYCSSSIASIANFSQPAAQPTQLLRRSTLSNAGAKSIPKSTPLI
jgi:hypothetical protein